MVTRGRVLASPRSFPPHRIFARAMSSFPSSGPTPALRTALRAAEGVVFVCSGNVVRSAFAELLARHRGLPGRLYSCATTFRNDGLFRETRAALSSRGVPASELDTFRPRHWDDVVDELCGRALVYFPMTAMHAASLRERVPDERIFLLAALLGRPQQEIADPVLDGADFDATFRVIERCVKALGALGGDTTAS